MSAAKYGERSIYQRVQVTSAPGAVLDGGSSGQVARNLLARVERPPDLFCCQSRVWVSRPGTRHSRNLTARPDVAIAIYDSHRPGGWSALYMTAVAEELENVDVALGAFKRRSEAQELHAWSRAEVVPPGEFRLCGATAGEQFVLDGHDRRLPVHLQ